MPARRATLLAIRRDQPLRPELQPRLTGVKHQTTYERRLYQALERAWPFVEDSLNTAAPLLGLEAEKLISTVASIFFEKGSHEGQLDPRIDAIKGKEHDLEVLLEEKGLDLDLACAELGLSAPEVARRCKEDPYLEARLDLAWLRGTSKLVQRLHAFAMSGDVKALMHLLQVRDSRYVPKLKVETTEEDILRSPAWRAVVEKLKAIFTTVPEGEGEEYRRGWADCAAEYQRQIVEELSHGG